MKPRHFHSHLASPGIAIGKVYRLRHTGLTFQRYWIRDRDVEREIKRFRLAVQLSREQIARIQTKLCRIQGREQIKIIESHRLLLQDEMLVATTIDTIRHGKINAEWALDKTLAQLKLSFLNVEEDYFRDRHQDIDYAGRRLMENLMGNAEFSYADLPEGEIVLVAHDISPADVANLPRDRIRGFVMEVGGETSHTAIIARALEIPAVLGVKDVLEQVDDGETIILDGIKGLVIASPHASELEQYRNVREKYAALDQLLLQDIHLPAKTQDGHRLRLEANVELIAEIPSILQHGAEGVGLYRTEYLFLDRLEEPSEEEQVANYVQILKAMRPKPVTIRTIDLGGDKLPLGPEYHEQANPALGLRGIRLCLRERSIFKTQLRALLRASTAGELRILFPLISNVEEIRQVKKILAEVKRELTQKKLRFHKSIPLGVMIEVPSAVLLAPTLAREVDFFSIGTNDLLQYGMAIDRTNELVSHLFTPFHPALLRMIELTMKAANKARIPVSICGEMAGDPLAIIFLAGFHLASLSMNPVSIPRAKKILRSLKRSDARALLSDVLRLETAQEVEHFIRRRSGKIIPVALRELGDLRS